MFVRTVSICYPVIKIPDFSTPRSHPQVCNTKNKWHCLYNEILYWLEDRPVSSNLEQEGKAGKDAQTDNPQTVQLTEIEHNVARSVARAGGARGRSAASGTATSRSSCGSSTATKASVDS
jgi:hypothetical protein